MSDDTEDLEKGWKSALAGMAVGAGLMYGHANPAVQQRVNQAVTSGVKAVGNAAKVLTDNYDGRINNPMQFIHQHSSQTAQPSVTHKTSIGQIGNGSNNPYNMTFDRKTLHPELLPIAKLESNYGQYMNHEAHSKGPFHTAVGALGFKPITAHEEYMGSPALKKLYPNLDQQEVFMKELTSNPSFYNNVAAHHWNTLKKTLGTPEKAAYGWRWGLGAAQKADQNTINADPYVQKYHSIFSSGMNKSEKLYKMAISAIKPGKLMHQESEGLKPKVYNYDHVLSPEQVAQGYSLRLKDFGDDFEANIHHNGEKVGYLTSGSWVKDPSYLHIDDALIDEKDPSKPIHRGKGLGQALYESTYSHAKNVKNMGHVVGGKHSSLAHAVHNKLASKHGLAYDPEPNIGGNEYPNPEAWKQNPASAYDAKYKGYHFALNEQSLTDKYQEFSKSWDEWVAIHKKHE